MCTARIDKNTSLHLGTKLYVKKDAGVLTKDAGGNGETVAVFLQKIDRETAKVWVTHMYQAAGAGNLPTYGFEDGATAADAHTAKRQKRADENDNGLEELYARIDAARQ